MGLMLNQPSSMTLPTLLEQLGTDQRVELSGDTRLLKGGPVSPEQAFVLHSKDKGYPRSLPLAAGALLSTDPQVLTDVAHGQGPEHYWVAHGYAGWGPGQLEQELAEHAWVSLALEGSLNLGALWQVPINERLAVVSTLVGMDPTRLGGRVGYA